MNKTQIEDALYDWVFDVLNIKVIHADQNAPKPKTSYALIKIVSLPYIGHPDTNSSLLGDDSADVEFSYLGDLFISINIYYGGAWDYANTLKKSLERTKVSESLFADGLGYHSSTAVKKLPQEINKQFIERSQFDVTFYLRTADDVENIETIQKIEITNEIDGYQTIIEKP